MARPHLRPGEHLKRTGVTLRPQHCAALQRLAHQEGVSLSALVRRAVEEFLAHRYVALEPEAISA